MQKVVLTCSKWNKIFKHKQSLSRHKNIHHGTKGFSIRVLCIRDQCKSDYGTCDLFTDYTQEVQTLNKINKHSNYDKKEKNEEHMKALDDFLLPGSVCALAAANNSADTLWFVQIKGEFESTTSVSDYYGHI